MKIPVAEEKKQVSKMAEPVKPVLQKPPGYRDPNAPPPKPAPKLPVRKPVLPQYYRTNTKRRSCRRICCCCFCILLFILALLGLATFGLFFLWFDPKLPVFHLQSFKIDRLNVTVKSDGTYLDSQTTVRVEAKNPNGKITLLYGGTRLSVTVGEPETEFGSSSLAGFTQGKKNTTSLKLTTRVKNGLVGDAVGTKLKARFRNRDLVVFSEVRTKIGFGVGRWKVGSVGVNVLCGGVTLKKLDGGVMPKCTINLLKWINIH